jgi:integrase
MPAAVGVYKALIKHQEMKQIPLDDESYLFFPHIKSRPYAQRIMGEFFDELLRRANLKVTLEGQTRTIYSLRHTAIAFRLLKGENVDLLFLARNCRTSVSMLDRFYCRHLSALMAPEKIVGLKSKN